MLALGWRRVGWAQARSQAFMQALALALLVSPAGLGCTLDRTPLEGDDRSGPSGNQGGTGGASGAGGGPVFPTGGAGGSGAGGAGGVVAIDGGDPNDFFQLDGGGIPLVNDSGVPIDTSVDCAATGVWGVRAEIDVHWGGRDGGLVALTDNGRGKLLNFVRININAVGQSGEFVGTTKLCGIDLPTFYSSTLCEAYKPEFPDTMFEAASMPTIAMSGHYQCLHPGCGVQFAPTAGLFGIDLAAPDAPWPNAGTLASLNCSLGAGLSCYPDDDSDSQPGIGVKLRTTGMPGVACPSGGDFAYNAAPLNSNPGAIFGGVVRTDRIMLGIRSALGGGGVFGADCKHAEGAGVAKFLESRAAGCMRQKGTADPFSLPAGPNDECSETEATFMDENMPIYMILEEGDVPTLKVDDMSPSAGTRFQLVRLGDLGESVSCAQVRDAF